MAAITPDDLAPFSDLAGTPVWWGRKGVTGTRRLRIPFLVVVERAFNDLWDRWGKGEGVVSFGAYVPRETSAGDRHSTGTAIDIGGIYWPGKKPLLCYRGRENARQYLAVEAVLRLHIPQVLGWWYDQAHHSHWHLDDREAARGFSTLSLADVTFVQACLCYSLDQPVGIDGRFGRQTLNALSDVMSCPPEMLHRTEAWGEFLKRVASGWG